MKQSKSVDYQAIIDEVYAEVKSLDLQGKVADYIPELAKVSSEKYGICLVDNQGNTFTAGDAEEPFSIQSISKVFTLTMVFHAFKSKLWHRVNVEPSGNPFNSIAQLEYENGIPRNPFMNAGALVITDALISKFENAKEKIATFISDIAGCTNIQINGEVLMSEMDHASRNRAVAYFLKAHQNIENENIENLIQTYIYHCSMEMNCVDLARSFSFFADQGYSRYCDRQILTPSQTKRLNALMLTCGFYDESGEFAFRVGLPGKSGVGGGIAAVLPGKFSIAVWSPELNTKGNSLRGIKTLELITDKISFSLF
ncbi:MAG: glutaminase [Cyclobacteriaceae bacterium]|nr:glutaminase [Cyclobacteriaceae bacterium]MCH8517472.1 glutaminase [Cyclobacteriaceae bacterium]